MILSFGILSPLKPMAGLLMLKNYMGFSGEARAPGKPKGEQRYAQKLSPLRCGEILLHRGLASPGYARIIGRFELRLTEPCALPRTRFLSPCRTHRESFPGSDYPMTAGRRSRIVRSRHGRSWDSAPILTRKEAIDFFLIVFDRFC